jgi:hypothetical protein
MATKPMVTKPMVTKPIPIFDVFQSGLRRGGASLPHDPKKKYFYVEHPTEGWRVYLRSAIFLHPLIHKGSVDKQHFLVVKKRGAHKTSAAWEFAGKGQMEWKDVGNRRISILNALEENVKRETEEESHVTEIEHLKHTGLVFQSQETTYPPNHYFQYHIFQGFITPEQVAQSFETFTWIKEHPKAFARWKRDRKEKDAVAWFDPRLTRLNPRWCPDIAALYLSH